jgi:fucose permease
LGCLAATFALSAAVPDIRVRTLAVLLFGLGEGAVESQATALLSDLSPDRERSMLNWSQLLFSAGAAGGPFLLALLFSLRTGATLAAVLWACSALCAAPALGFALPIGRRRAAPAPRAAPRVRAAPPGADAAQPVPEIRGRLIGGIRLGQSGLVVLAVAVFLYVAAEMGTASWLAKYGELELGLGAALAPICISVFWAGLSASRILAASLSARVPDAPLLYGSLALSLLGQVLAFSLRQPVAALAGIALTGVGMGAIWPTLVAVAGRRYREGSGTAIGALVASGGAAVALIQLAVGWLSAPQRLGLRVSLLGLAVFTAANLLVVRGALPARSTRKPRGISIFRP